MNAKEQREIKELNRKEQRIIDQLEGEFRNLFEKYAQKMQKEVGDAEKDWWNEALDQASLLYNR